MGSLCRQGKFSSIQLFNHVRYIVEDKAFRKKIIQSLHHNLGLECLEGDWEGEFPIFHCGAKSFNLLGLGGSTGAMEKSKKELTSLIGFNPGYGTPEGEGYTYPKAGLKYRKIQGRPYVTMTRGDKTFFLVRDSMNLQGLPPNLAGLKIWKELGSETPDILCLNGEEVKYTLKTSNENERKPPKSQGGSSTLNEESLEKALEKLQIEGFVQDPSSLPWFTSSLGPETKGKTLEGEVQVQQKTLDVPPYSLSVEAPKVLGSSEKELDSKLKTSKKNDEPKGPETYEVVKILKGDSQEEALEKLELGDFTHGLDFLSWFAPLSDLKTERRIIDGAMQLKTLKWPSLNLSFDVEVREGKKRAYGKEELSGFFIAENQKRGKENPFPHSLLLKNDKGEEKLVLRAPSIAKSIGTLLLTKLGVKQSLLMEQLVPDLKIKDHEPKAFIYKKEASGELSSRDPEALLHLVVYYFTHGQVEKAQAALRQLKAFGRQKPFPFDLFSQIDKLSLALTFFYSDDATELALQMLALSEENKNIYQQVIDSKKIEAIISSFLVLQAHFALYLRALKRGKKLKLDSFEELFLLNKLTYSVRKYCGGLNGGVSGFVGNVGALVAGQMVILPEIQQRYAELLEAHGENSLRETRSRSLAASYMSGCLDPFFQHPLLEANGQQRIPVKGNSNAADLVQRSGALLRDCLNNPYRRVANLTPKEVKELDLDRDISDVSVELCDLTPQNIQRGFFAFYRLVTDQVPAEGWEESPEKLQLFKEKREKLLKNLPLIKGRAKDPLQDAMMASLQAISLDPKSKQLPLAQELEEEYERGKVADDSKPKQPSAPVVQESEEDHDYGEITHLVKVFQQALWIEATQKLGKAAKDTLLNNTALKTLRTQSTFETLESMANLTLAAKVNSKIYKEKMALNAAVSTLTVARKVADAVLQKESPAVAEIKSKHSRPESSDSINPATQAAMKDREESINQVMGGFLAEYFTITSKPAPLEEGEKATSFEVPGDEDSVREGFKKLNQSIEDYYERGKKDPKKTLVNSYSLKEGANVGELEERLKTLRDEVDERLKSEKTQILELCNRYQQTGSEKSIMCTRLLGQEEEKADLNFEELNRFFIQGKDKELMEATHMPKEALEKLKEQLYLYHIMASRWNLLFDQLNRKIDLSSPSGAQIIGEELNRRRVYGFTEASEKLVRGKLLFESRTRKMLWDKQVSQMDCLLQYKPEKEEEGKPKRLVVELIMGSGKSWYGLPITAFVQADGDNIVINVWPAPVAETNIEGIGEQAQTIFDQVSNALSCLSRSMHWNLERVWGIRQVFQRTRSQKEQINTTKESLQAMQLVFIEKALQKENTESQHLEILGELKKTLKLMRFHGRASIDETHVAFDRKKELNHPLGKAKKPKRQDVHVISEVVLALLEAEELKDILDIKSKTPKRLEEKKYLTQVLPILVKKVAALPLLNIPESERGEFEKYLCGTATKVPESLEKHKNKREIDLAKGLLESLLPAALGQILNVDFAVSSNKEEGRVCRPSEGHMNVTKASIEMSHEAVLKTALMLIHSGLENEDIDWVINFLRDRARVRAGKEKIPVENTLEAQFFKSLCPKYNLMTLKQEGKDYEEVQNLLRKNDRFTMIFLKEKVCKEILSFEEKLSSNSINFGSMFKGFDSDTGTPFNEVCHPHGTKLLADPGSDGESIDVMVKLCSDPDTISVLNEEDPSKVVESILKDHFSKGSDCSAFIDRGAVTNGMDSQEVARRMLDHIRANRPDKEAVAFFKGSMKMIWRKEWLHPRSYSEYPMAEEKYVSLFPQPQTYAADIPQQKGGIGVVSVGEDLKLNELSQAIWRMRGLKKKEQKLRFVMTKHVAKKICKSGKPTIRDIIRFAAFNEGRLLAEDKYAADRNKIEDVVRQAVLDKALLASTVQETIQILWDFREVFVKSVETDPSKLFGGIKTAVKPEQALAALRKKCYGLVENSALFTEEDKQEIHSTMEEIGKDGGHPKEVFCYVNANGEMIDGGSGIGNSIEMENENDVEVEQEQENENDTELFMEVNQHLDTIAQEGMLPLVKQEFYPWSKGFKPRNLDSWLNIQEVDSGWQFKKSDLLGRIFDVSKYQLGAQSELPELPPIFRMRDVLNKSSLQGADVLANKISSRILATNNATHLVARNGFNVNPLGPQQIPLLEALVIQDKVSTIPYVILISQEEVKIWRKKLKAERLEARAKGEGANIGIYDIGTRLIVAEGANKLGSLLESNLEFKKMITQIKFIRGDVHYQRDQQNILGTWLQSDNEEMMDYFHEVHKLHATSKFRGSVLESVSMNNSHIRL